MTLPEELRMVSNMIHNGEKIQYGRETALMDIAADEIERLQAEAAVVIPFSHFTYKMGAKLRKKSGSEWFGKVVGYYSTEQTPEGYAIESAMHKHTVQIYPLAALEKIV